MRFGAHVKTAGGLPNAIHHARRLGAETLQIFVGAPQQWKEAAYPDEQVAEFRQQAEVDGLGPVFIHAPYLINLASPRAELRGMSRRSLAHQLLWADRLGARGVVVHVGSGEEDAVEQAARSLAKVLDDRTGDAAIILENDAGAGRRVGRSFTELGSMIRLLDRDPRLLCCLDTAHTLASGYEIRTPEGLEATLAEFDREVGLDRLVLVHANDSKVDLGSNRDRHENIGEGFIGAEAFARLLHRPEFARLPFILEVPGFDGGGPDRENLALLRQLAE